MNRELILGHQCQTQNFCGQVKWFNDKTDDPILEEPDFVEFEVCVFTLGLEGWGHLCLAEKFCDQVKWFNDETGDPHLGGARFC